MTKNEKKQVIDAFVNSCPYHNLRHETCEDDIERSPCDGNCKYVARFSNEIKSEKK